MEWEQHIRKNEKKWSKYGHKIPCRYPIYDYDECRECEVLSEKHLRDLLKFLFK